MPREKQRVRGANTNIRRVKRYRQKSLFKPLILVFVIIVVGFGLGWYMQNYAPQQKDGAQSSSRIIEVAK